MIQSSLPNPVQDCTTYYLTCTCYHMQYGPYAFHQVLQWVWVHLWSCCLHGPASHHHHYPMSTHLHQKLMQGSVSHLGVQLTSPLPCHQNLQLVEDTTTINFNSSKKWSYNISMWFTSCYFLQERQWTCHQPPSLDRYLQQLCKSSLLLLTMNIDMWLWGQLNEKSDKT